MKEVIKIKEWFYNKLEGTSSSYNCFIDLVRNDEGIAIVDNGFVSAIIEERLAESEKAIQVILRTGDVVGTSKGWKTWIPKSVLA